MNKVLTTIPVREMVSGEGGKRTFDVIPQDGCGVVRVYECVDVSDAIMAVGDFVGWECWREVG